MARLTTITTIWGRRKVLEIWLEAIRHATIDDVEHLLFFVGEKAPSIKDPSPGLRVIEFPKIEPFSIGHCHNTGARLANTEWIMKMDIDSLPTLMFFRELMSVLDEAGPRDWFNCGMLYLKRIYNDSLLTVEKMPIGSSFHRLVTQNLRLYSAQSYSMPQATNFICRTQDYIDLGGCDTRFDGYGWEDYQQIYMLERWQRGSDPLQGPLHEHNVTQRCRDEIGRPKALELFRRNSTFCLLHRWHAMSSKVPEKLMHNRRILLENILKRRD